MQLSAVAAGAARSVGSGVAVQRVQTVATRGLFASVHLSAPITLRYGSPVHAALWRAWRRAQIVLWRGREGGGERYGTPTRADVPPARVCRSAIMETVQGVAICYNTRTSVRDMRGYYLNEYQRFLE